MTQAETENNQTITIRKGDDQENEIINGAHVVGLFARVTRRTDENYCDSIEDEVLPDRQPDAIPQGERVIRTKERNNDGERTAQVRTNEIQSRMLRPKRSEGCSWNGEVKTVREMLEGRGPIITTTGIKAEGSIRRRATGGGRKPPSRKKCRRVRSWLFRTF
jgi:hypothetical protein